MAVIHLWSGDWHPAPVFAPVVACGITDADALGNRSRDLVTCRPCLDGRSAPAHDPVETPLHYRWHPSGVECIDIAAAFDYSLGNVIKYVWRCDYKGKPIEDLRKAQTYLERAIKEREATSASAPSDDG